MGRDDIKHLSNRRSLPFFSFRHFPHPMFFTLEQRLRESIDGSVVQVRTETFEKNGCRYIDLRAQCLENLAQTAEIEKP